MIWNLKTWISLPFHYDHKTAAALIDYSCIKGIISFFLMFLKNKNTNINFVWKFREYYRYVNDLLSRFIMAWKITQSKVFRHYSDNVSILYAVKIKWQYMATYFSTSIGMLSKSSWDQISLHSPLISCWPFGQFAGTVTIFHGTLLSLGRPLIADTIANNIMYLIISTYFFSYHNN